MFDWSLKPKAKEKRITYQHNIIHLADQNVTNFINFNMNNGPWIAGGAALAWYNKEPVGDGDIDIWCKNEAQFAEIDKLCKNLELSLVADTPNASSYTGSNGPTIQIIKRLFTSPQAIIDDFDISVCQLVTDGNLIKFGSKTLHDIKTKTLRFTRFKEFSWRRMLKYQTYGYIPTDEVIDYFSSNIDKFNWDNNFESDYS